MESTMPDDTPDFSQSDIASDNPADISPHDKASAQSGSHGDTLPGWIRLLMTQGLGLADKRALISGLGNPDEFFSTDNHRLSELLRIDSARIRQIKSVDSEQVESILSTMRNHAMGFLPFTDPAFPQLLSQISSPPLGLFYKGNVSLIGGAQLAIVGSRNPTPSGIRTAEDFAAELSLNNLSITSGLAEGIDSAAHRGCLKAGGSTIASTPAWCSSCLPTAPSLRCNATSTALSSGTWVPCTMDSS